MGVVTSQRSSTALAVGPGLGRVLRDCDGPSGVLDWICRLERVGAKEHRLPEKLLFELVCGEA